jgi:hypothetical protein
VAELAKRKLINVVADGHKALERRRFLGNTFKIGPKDLDAEVIFFT